MIETFDNLIPFIIRSHAYTFVTNSNYKLIGWNDRNDLELSHEHNLHSSWTLQDLKNCKLAPYIEKALNKSKFKYTLDDFFNCNINVVSPNSVHYTHAHYPGTVAVLYYVNLEWQHNWAGETIFYDEDMKKVAFTSPYVPGRFIIFDNEPHSIRPQSAIAPKFRFTLTLLLLKKEKK